MKAETKHTLKKYGIKKTDYVLEDASKIKKSFSKFPLLQSAFNVNNITDQYTCKKCVDIAIMLETNDRIKNDDISILYDARNISVDDYNNL